MVPGVTNALDAGVPERSVVEGYLQAVRFFLGVKVSYLIFFFFFFFFGLLLSSQANEQGILTEDISRR